MDDLLVFNSKGEVIDKTQKTAFIGNTFSFYGGTGGVGGTGSVAVWNGFGSSWTGSWTQTTLPKFSKAASVIGPKFISIPGGTFYKSQDDEQTKYTPTIFGKFSK